MYQLNQNLIIKKKEGQNLFWGLWEDISAK